LTDPRSKGSVLPASANTIFGYLAGQDIASGGVDNTYFGHKAGSNNATGDDNVFMGSNAGKGSHGNSNSNNVGLGSDCMLAVSTGSANTSIGKDSSKAITDGHNNVAIGNNALETSTSVGYAVAIGDDAMKSGDATSAADGTIAIGGSALSALTTGAKNTAIGYECMDATDDGAWNTAVGYQALSANCGNNNVAVGVNALLVCTSEANTAIGTEALKSLTSGEHNTAIGNSALSSEDTGDRNTAVGNNSLANVNGADNNSNTGLGYNSGDVITTGTNNTCIGANTDPSANDGANQTVIGAGATGQANNSVTLGNSAVTNNYLREKIELKARNDQPAILELQADNADNNADLWQIEAGTDGIFQIKHKDTGSFADAFTIGGSTGEVTIAGHGTAAHNGTSMLLVQDTGVKTGGNFTIGTFNATINDGDGDSSDTFIGTKSQLVFNDTGESFGVLYGLVVHAESTETADEESTAIVGLDATAKIAGTHSDVGNIYGSTILTNVDGGTIDQSVYGEYIDVDIESGCTISGSVFTLNLRSDADTNPSGEVDGIYNYMATNADWAYVHYDAANSTNRVLMSAAGQIDAEGTINASQSLDYAEYFESKDGKVIANGTSVKLDGGKIVPCSDDDTPLGVIRPKSAQCIVGGGQIFHWKDRFVKDDYGADVWESYTLTKWTEEITFEEYIKRGKDETGGAIGGIVTDSKVEGDVKKDIPHKYYRKHKYHSDRLPKDVTAPKDAETITPAKKRQKLNPDYDASKSYKSREERDEWHIVGLLGQIPVTKGQPTGSWIKMKDVSDTVEMYFVK